MKKIQLFFTTLFDQIDNADPGEVIIYFFGGMLVVIFLFIVISSYLNAKSIKKQRLETVTKTRIQRDAVGRRMKR